mmetsp:Transcript_21839/g.76637  ORF Transcript_21839/g.76637 Transcript_21839/m.76637 type:complete len:214 (+) Transcript_21839:1486-2127(+)
MSTAADHAVRRAVSSSTASAGASSTEGGGDSASSDRALTSDPCASAPMCTHSGSTPMTSSMIAFRRRPSDATITSGPPDRLPPTTLSTSRRTSASRTRLFPVPGPPQMAATRFVSASRMACAWLASKRPDRSGSSTATSPEPAADTTPEKVYSVPVRSRYAGGWLSTMEASCGSTRPSVRTAASDCRRFTVSCTSVRHASRESIMAYRRPGSR